LERNNLGVGCSVYISLRAAALVRGFHSCECLMMPFRDLRMKALSSGLRTPMYPYVAPHTSKIHTLVTLGIRHCTKPRVFKVRNCLPRGFDSHRPLHFSLSGVPLCCPRTRLSLSPGSHSLDAATTVPLIGCVDRVRSRWSHPSVIDHGSRWSESAFRQQNWVPRRTVYLDRLSLEWTTLRIGHWSSYRTS